MAVLFLGDFFFATFLLAKALGDAFFFVDRFLAPRFFVDFCADFLALDFLALDFLALGFFFADFAAARGADAFCFFGDFPLKAVSQPSEYFSVEPTLKIDIIVL